MSYAIIRNANYKRDNLAGLYKHNERKNTNYSNKDINKNNSINNYSIKKCNTTYSKAIKQLINENDLKCRITSYTNLVCEFIITSDKEFFDSIGENETKRYFQTAYDFVANYKNLGEKYILSAKVHMDESTPHLHLVFVPVVSKTDKKNRKQVNKIACSEYWKGKNSYQQLQDSFYQYIKNNQTDVDNVKTTVSSLKKLFKTYKKEIKACLKIESNKTMTAERRNKIDQLKNDLNQLEEYEQKIYKYYNVGLNVKIKSLPGMVGKKWKKIKMRFKRIVL